MRCSPTRSVYRTKMTRVAGIIPPFALALLLVLALQLAAVYSGIYDTIPMEGLRRPGRDPGIAPVLRQLTPMAGRFVQFSAYRQSPTTFYVVGLYSRIPRDAGNPVHDCVWMAGNDTKSPGTTGLNTTAVVHYIKQDEHSSSAPYAVAVVKCEFAAGVGNDGLGGLLYLKVPTFTYDRVFSWFGGRRWRFDSMETLLSLREDRSSNFDAIATRPFPYKHAFCGPPIAGESILQSWIVQWLTYHLYIMKDDSHFFFYNVGGLNEQGRKLLDPFVRAGFVTVTDVLQEATYASWYHGQVLYINDCLHRTRFVADWTFFCDFDEVLYFRAPLTLGRLLEANANASFVSLGSWPVDTEICTKPKHDDEWPLEQMMYKKQQGPECRGSASKWVCPESSGRRKFFLNPLKVFTVGVHSLVQPENEDTVLHASLARLDHYRGVLSSSTICRYRIGEEPTNHTGNRRFYKQYPRDDTVAAIVGQAREHVRILLLKPGERNVRSIHSFVVE